MPNWLKKESVQERKVCVTYEAIYDIVETEEYIRNKFGDERAAKYRWQIKEEIKNLSITASIYTRSDFKYRNYVIYKKPFSPAIIFWVIKDDGVVHVLRVPREEYDWKRYFKANRYSEYSYPV